VLASNTALSSSCKDFTYLQVETRTIRQNPRSWLSRCR